MVRSSVRDLAGTDPCDWPQSHLLQPNRPTAISRNRKPDGPLFPYLCSKQIQRQHPCRAWKPHQLAGNILD